MTAESPCIGVCRLDPAGRECVGCRRTLDEIARWSRTTEAERREVLKALEQRRERKVAETTTET